MVTTHHAPADAVKCDVALRDDQAGVVVKLTAAVDYWQELTHFRYQGLILVCSCLDVQGILQVIIVRAPSISFPWRLPL